MAHYGKKQALKTEKTQNIKKMTKMWQQNVVINEWIGQMKRQKRPKKKKKKKVKTKNWHNKHKNTLSSYTKKEVVKKKRAVKHNKKVPKLIEMMTIKQNKRQMTMSIPKN